MRLGAICLSHKDPNVAPMVIQNTVAETAVIARYHSMLGKYAGASGYSSALCGSPHGSSKTDATTLLVLNWHRSCKLRQRMASMLCRNNFEPKCVCLKS